VGYELRKQSHALPLAGLTLCKSQGFAYMWRSGTLTSSGSASPTKHGRVVIPIHCRTAAICAAASVTLKGTPRGRNLTLAGPGPECHACL